MLAESSIRENRFLNIVLVSMPGNGKTKFSLDFPGIVLVDFDYGDLTAQDMGINVPVLHPRTEDEIRAIIEAPEMVIREVIHKMKGFENYLVETWSFDTVTTMADIIMGEGSKAPVELDGYTIPGRPATGILSIPGDRKNADIPEWGDSHIFGVRMRRMMLAIKQMPYHTILTGHLGDPDHMEVSMKPDKKTGMKPKPKKGYPLLHGQLKWQLAGLTDFYLELNKKGGGIVPYKYLINSQPESGGAQAKSRLANHLAKQIDWTKKNAFDILNNPLQKALEESKKEV